MVVTASYGMEGVVITTAEVTGYQVTPSPLTDGTQQVTITYSELGETCQTTYPVTVTHRLTSIEVTSNPSTMTYEYGDTLQTTGMVVLTGIHLRFPGINALQPRLLQQVVNRLQLVTARIV